MRVSLFLTLGLALGLVCLVSVSASVGLVEAQGPCDRYVVAIGGANASDCSVETLPCKTVQWAIDHAADGDVICVADRSDLPGPTFYNETILIIRSLTLDGKWAAVCAGTPSKCHFRAVPCAPESVVLDAGGAGRVIGTSGDIKPTIDCFTITEGDAGGLGGDPDGNDASGGIYNRIAFNGAGDSRWGQGGGIMLRHSATQVLHSSAAAIESHPVAAGLPVPFGQGHGDAIGSLRPASIVDSYCAGQPAWEAGCTCALAPTILKA